VALHLDRRAAGDAHARVGESALASAEENGQVIQIDFRVTIEVACGEVRGPQSTISLQTGNRRNLLPPRVQKAALQLWRRVLA